MEPQAELVELFTNEAHDFPLDVGLLLLAACRPGCQRVVPRALDELDRLAAECAANSAAEVLEYFFGVAGFRGDDVDYHDSQNSFLDSVLQRRCGMPITLGAVAIEIARRCGVVLEPIGMPGHFLLRDVASRDFFDPFQSGPAMNHDDCVTKFRSIHGDAAFDSRFLVGIDNRSVAIRVINNLVVTYRTRDPTSLDWVLDLRLQLPIVGHDRRSLAQLCEMRGRFGDAALLFDQVAEQTGNSMVARHAAELRARLN